MSARARTGWIAGILCFVCVAVQAAPPTIPTDVKDNIRGRVDEGLHPSIVVGIVNPDGTAFFAYGTTRIGGDKKASETTIYEIGSITKVFTSILLAQLVEDGVVKLDDTLDMYLPPGVKAPARGDMKVTLRQLATHTSGLPRLPTNLSPKDGDDPYADYDEEALFTYLDDCQVGEGVGKEYAYSNLGAGMLGYILAEKKETTYEKLVIERICKPLGMKSTRIALSKKQQARFATPYAGDEQAKPWQFDSLAGCGALRSTARDMLKFLQAAIGLKKTSLRAAFDLTMKDRLQTKDPEMQIALGWHIYNKFGSEILWHNGGTGGFRSFCGFRPDTRTGVVVLGNSTIEVGDIGLHLLNSSHELKAVPKTVPVDRKILESYVGWYEMPTSKSLYHITLDGDKLMAKLDNQDAIRIYPESETLFVYRVVDARITFVCDKNGAPTSLILHQNGMDQIAMKQGPDFKPPKAPVEIKIDPKALKDYVGTYKLGLSMDIDVTLAGDALMVQLTGQPSIRVYPFAKDRFFYKVVKAELTFERDPDGKVSGLVLHQNGRDMPAPRVQ